MNGHLSALVGALAAALSVAALAEPATPASLKVNADRIVGDRNTEAFAASGRVDAVAAPYRLLSECVERTPDRGFVFSANTHMTTCTNALGHQHWHINGAIDYHDGEYAEVHDAWVYLWELPVFYSPYLYYPIGSLEGWRIMPGYTSKWGAYLLTKYVYHLAGDRTGREGTYSLRGATRFDLRSEQGVAFGQSLRWQLGDYGKGHFKAYYAWDQGDYDDRYGGSDDFNSANWGSEIKDDRYALELEHRWDVTERDVLRMRGVFYSDSYMREDFLSDSLFSMRSQWLGERSSEIAWEHNENPYGCGVSVSGPLNDFIGGTAQLPEFYFDVNPTPVFGLPVNYESQTRVGYYVRDYAHYASGRNSVYGTDPGVWANYNTGRLDTYHRLTAPMKFADVLSVVPRVAYRGTYWGESGRTSLDGWSRAGATGSAPYRSIVEGGVTFAARGEKDLDNGLRHWMEPYLDVLLQEADYSNLSDGERPYVFDAYDASLDWSDQFAGRGRNLPYSYYGVTPGLRNALWKIDEKGEAHPFLDLDVYCAIQFNEADWTAGDSHHKLSKPGEPNYGDGAEFVPGARLRWFPWEGAMLSSRIEYDEDNDNVALADVAWNQRVSGKFSYYLKLTHRDYRYWDYSSSPYDADKMEDDDFNDLLYSYTRAGFEHEICDAVVWSPYVCWNNRQNELDSTGLWVDFRTDCLGFRFLFDYEKDITRIDGSKDEEDFRFGFYIYLRAFGADASDIFK